jgi:hypothetical protein
MGAAGQGHAPLLPPKDAWLAQAATTHGCGHQDSREHTYIDSSRTYHESFQTNYHKQINT